MKTCQSLCFWQRTEDGLCYSWEQSVPTVGPTGSTGSPWDRRRVLLCPYWRNNGFYWVPMRQATGSTVSLLKGQRVLLCPYWKNNGFYSVSTGGTQGSTVYLRDGFYCVSTGQLTDSTMSLQEGQLVLLCTRGKGSGMCLWDSVRGRGLGH